MKAGKKALTEQGSFAGEIKVEAHSGSESGSEFQSELEAGSEKCSLSACKTSLIVYLEKDRPGALYEILGAFAKRKINLTKIESRPSKKELGDYYFYIDFEGHTSDAAYKRCLRRYKGQS